MKAIGNRLLMVILYILTVGVTIAVAFTYPIYWVLTGRNVLDDLFVRLEAIENKLLKNKKQ